MGEHKHTPGPWEDHLDDLSTMYKPSSSIMCGNTYIAKVYNWAPRTPSELLPEDENRKIDERLNAEHDANVQLIKAAPDLLEVVEQARDYLEELAADHIEVYSFDLHQRLLGVIAEATGQTIEAVEQPVEKPPSENEG